MLPKDTEHFRTGIMLPMKRFTVRLKQPLKNMVKSCPAGLRNGSLGFSKSKRTETENVCVKAESGGFYPQKLRHFSVKTEF